jgi:hypothetical protein
MMVDYLAAAVNPDQPYISQPLTDLTNKLATIPAYKNIRIDHPPDINDAVLGLFTVSLYSIEGFATSPTVKTIIGTYDASLVPAKIFLDTIGAMLKFFGITAPEIDIDMPPAGGKLPGVEPPAKSADKADGDTKTDGKSDTPVKPDAANTQEIKQINGGEKSDTDNTDIQIINGVRVKNMKESINEHLKKRVAQLMRS